ncbi:hypothetical protein MOQ_009862, partial [Trypanosoma cruzi marinkellei]
MSVTCSDREHVAADNTDEVSEQNATGHKTSFSETGVAGSGFVAEGDVGRLSQRNATGHGNKPQLRELTAQYSGSGGSLHDCFALLYDAKLTLRELIVDSTVRILCVLSVVASSGIVWSCGSFLNRRVWICGFSRRRCAAFPACCLLLFTFNCLFYCFFGIISIVAVPLFTGRLLHTVMRDMSLLFCFVFCCP